LHYRVNANYPEAIALWHWCTTRFLYPHFTPRKCNPKSSTPKLLFTPPVCLKTALGLLFTPPVCLKTALQRSRDVRQIAL
jgi:hypothetical protein